MTNLAGNLILDTSLGFNPDASSTSAVLLCNTKGDWFVFRLGQTSSEPADALDICEFLGMDTKDMYPVGIDPGDTKCRLRGSPSSGTGGVYNETDIVMDLTPFNFPRKLLEPDAKVGDIYRSNDEAGRRLTVWHLAEHVLDKNMLRGVNRLRRMIQTLRRSLRVLRQQK
jgi:hypothetical protein